MTLNCGTSGQLLFVGDHGPEWKAPLTNIQAGMNFLPACDTVRDLPDPRGLHEGTAIFVRESGETYMNVAYAGKWSLLSVGSPAYTQEQCDIMNDEMERERTAARLTNDELVGLYSQKWWEHKPKIAAPPKDERKIMTSRSEASEWLAGVDAENAIMARNHAKNILSSRD